MTATPTSTSTGPTTVTAPPAVLDPRASAPPGPARTASGVSGGTRRAFASRPGPRLRDFRPDVEGLRAVAVLAVVAYHAGVPGFGGGFVGVDVFLVISGFLITGMLVRELEATGRIDLARFYSRRARRLLPAAVLVTVVTTFAGWLLLSPLAARDLVRDAAFTSVYGMNWHLAQQGTDYLNAAKAPSALQHYWSLAVEEQYYLLWPAVLLGVWLLVARLRRRGAAAGAPAEAGVVDVRDLPDSEAASGRPRLVVAGVLGLVVAASLAASVVQTRSSAPWAYFGLHTRAWELALGALVALLAPALSWRARWTSAALSWAGIAAVGLAVVAYDESTPFPGSAALLPVLGAAAVVAGGCSAPRAGAEVLLGRAPLQVIGALSYGWYLWHWPLLMLAPAAVGHPLSTRGRVATCVLALLLAALCYAVVEHPVRAAVRLQSMTAAVLGTAVTATAALAAASVAALALAPAVTGTGQDQQLADLAAPAPVGSPGSAPGAPGSAPGPSGPSTAERIEARIDTALQAGLRPAAVPANLVPRLDQALTTLPLAQQEGCHAGFATARVPTGVGTTSCVYGDRGAKETVVLFGDSHALQWFPALDHLARARHWRLVSLTKSSCTPFGVTVWNETLKRAYTECDSWRADALALVRRLHPQRVVVSAFTGVLDHGLDGGGDGFDRAWAAGVGTTMTALKATGADVTVLDDTPDPGQDVPACVAEDLQDTSACTFGRGAGLYPPARRTAQHSASVQAGVRVVDPTAWVCLERCPVVVGNVLVYRDAHHISPQFARWLEPALDLALAAPATAAR